MDDRNRIKVMGDERAGEVTEVTVAKLDELDLERESLVKRKRRKLAGVIWTSAVLTPVIGFDLYLILVKQRPLSLSFPLGLAVLAGILVLLVGVNQLLGSGRRVRQIDEQIDELFDGTALQQGSAPRDDPPAIGRATSTRTG